MTAKDIIESALREIGVLMHGSAANSDTTVWALGVLNRLLGSLSANGILVYVREHENFTLTSGTAAYTIGSGLTFDTSKPKVVENAFIRDSDHDYPLDIKPIREYWTLSDKTTQSRPINLFLDPVGVIYLYYTPDSSYALHIVSQKPFTKYTATSTEVDLPVEYEDFLISNLAVRMCPKYGIVISPDLRIMALETMSSVRSRNLADQMKSVELNIGGTSSSYDIEAG